MKKLTQVIASPRPHWVGDGFLVNPLFADHAFSNDISPFLMLDYAAPHEFKPSTKPPGAAFCTRNFTRARRRGAAALSPWRSSG